VGVKETGIKLKSSVAGTIFRDKVMFEVDFSEYEDGDVTWFVEKGVTAKPDLNDEKLELHQKASCCGTFLRVIYTIFNQDHTGRGRTQAHHAYCAECGHKFSGALAHHVTKDQASEFQIWFGKHKGKKLAEIPKDYLEWCLKNIEDDKVKRKIEAFLS
jgi:hypothetical protein